MISIKSLVPTLSSAIRAMVAGLQVIPGRNFQVDMGTYVGVDYVNQYWNITNTHEDFVKELFTNEHYLTSKYTKKQLKDFEKIASKLEEVGL